MQIFFFFLFRLYYYSTGKFDLNEEKHLYFQSVFLVEYLQSYTHFLVPLLDICRTAAHSTPVSNFPDSLAVSDPVFISSDPLYKLCFCLL